MGFCKDCRYWEFHHDTRDKQWMTCDLAEWVEYDSKIAEDGFAFYADASDDSGLYAGVKTGPLFGCLHFSANKRT